jgi:hypothetical protein
MLGELKALIEGDATGFEEGFGAGRGALKSLVDGDLNGFEGVGGERLPTGFLSIDIGRLRMPSPWTAPSGMGDVPVDAVGEEMFGEDRFGEDRFGEGSLSRAPSKSMGSKPCGNGFAERSIAVESFRKRSPWFPSGPTRLRRSAGEVDMVPGRGPMEVWVWRSAQSGILENIHGPWLIVPQVN